MRRPDRTLLSVLLCVGLTLATPLPVAVGAEFAAAENHYRLTYTASSPRSLAVEAEIDVVGDALTMDWASASFLDEGWATFVCDLRAYGLDGAEVALSPEGAGRWRLDRGLDRVRLSYTVRLEHDLIGWDEGGHDEAAYVLDDLIFFVGKAVFVTAGQREDSQSRETFSVELDLPSGYEVTAPWQRLPGPGHRFFVEGPRALIISALLVGEQETVTLGTAGLEVVLAAGTDFAEVLPMVEGIFEPLVPAAIALFDATPGSKFVFIANRAPRTEAVGPYFSGGVLGSAMSLIAPAVPGPEMLPMLTYMVAHEFLHLWNGSRIQTVDYEREYWFSEGFTDYLTVRLLHALGLVDDEHLLNGERGILDNYRKYLAVGGDLSLRAAGLAKQENYDLVYSGGFVFAVILDLETRHASHGANGLVDYMREVYRRFGAAEDPRRATLEELEQVASEVAGVDLGPLFLKSVEEAGVMALGEHLARAGLGIGEGTGSAESIVVLDDASEAELALRRQFLAPVIAPSDG